MDPIIIGTIILSSIALVSSIVSNMRIRSKCRAGDALELSITKQFNKDLGNEEQIKKYLSSLDYSSD